MGCITLRPAPPLLRPIHYMLFCYIVLPLPFLALSPQDFAEPKPDRLVTNKLVGGSIDGLESNRFGRGS